MRTVIFSLFLLPFTAFAAGGHIGRTPLEIEQSAGSNGLKSISAKNTILSAEEVSLLDKARRLLVEKEGVEGLKWPVMVNVADRSAQVWNVRTKSYFRLSLAD